MMDETIYTVSSITIVGLVLLLGTLVIAYPPGDGGLPVVDNETMTNCARCFLQYNLTFDNPVEAYYWTVVNIHKDPEIIVMKYEIGTACHRNCTIPDERESEKMARRVYTP